MEEHRKLKRINQVAHPLSFKLSGKESFRPLQKKQQQATTSLYILNKEERFGNAFKWKKKLQLQKLFTLNSSINYINR